MNSPPKHIITVVTLVALALFGLAGLFFVSLFDDLPSLSNAASVIFVLAWSTGLAIVWLSRPRLIARTHTALLACASALAACLFLAGLYFTDRSVAYAAGLALPAALATFGRPRDFLVSLPLAGSVLSIAALALAPAYRLERYSVSLRNGCWCCCVRDRAIAELCSLGPEGAAAIRREVANAPRVGFVLDRNAVLARVPPGPDTSLVQLRAWLSAKSAF